VEAILLSPDITPIQNLKIREIPITLYLLRGGFVYVFLLFVIAYKVLEALAPELVLTARTVLGSRAVIVGVATVLGAIAALMHLIHILKGNPHGEVRYWSMFNIMEVNHEGKPYLFIESRDNRPIYSFEAESNDEIIRVVQHLDKYGADPRSKAVTEIQINGGGDFDEKIMDLQRPIVGKQEQFIVRKRVGPLKSAFDRDELADVDELWADVYLRGHRRVSLRALLKNVTRADIARIRDPMPEWDKLFLPENLVDFLRHGANTIERIKKHLEHQDRRFLMYARGLATVAASLLLLSFVRHG